LDGEVVDVERADGCQQMLDRLHADVPCGEARSAIGRGDVLEAGLKLGLAVQVDAPEADARIGVRRLERQARRAARVQSDTFQCGFSADRLLLRRRHSLPCSLPKIARSSARIRSIRRGSLKSAACARNASRCGRAGYPL